jgi:hypothetical protein
MKSEGCWWITSESDPRWNAHGRTSVGMFDMPAEAKVAIERKKSELGEEPPKDLTWGYEKD